MIAIALLLAAAAADARPPSFGPVFGGAAATGGGVESVVIDPTQGTFVDTNGLLSNVSFAAGVLSADLTCDGVNRDGVTDGAHWFFDFDELIAQGLEVDTSSRFRLLIELELQSDSDHVVGTVISAGYARLTAGALTTCATGGWIVPNTTSCSPIINNNGADTPAGSSYAHVLGTDGPLLIQLYVDRPASHGYAYTYTYGTQALATKDARPTMNASTDPADHGIVVGLSCYTGTASGTIKAKTTVRLLPEPE